MKSRVGDEPELGLKLSGNRRDPDSALRPGFTQGSSQALIPKPLGPDLRFVRFQIRLSWRAAS